MYKLTSFTSHTTGEGERLSFTYSHIENGEIKEMNIRKSLIIDEDEEIVEAVDTIRKYLKDKLPN